MADRLSRELPGGVTVHMVVSDAADGDLGITSAGVERRREALAPVPWTWLHQVHGAAVVMVGEAGAHAGDDADALVTAAADATLAVQVADCAPVLLWAPSPQGAVVAAVHAGWRGLLAGVLPAAVRAMAGLGAGEVHWMLGPCISPPAYEFGEGDLEAVAAALGPGVRARTAAGAPALDLRAAVAASLASSGVTAPAEGPPPACTATSGRHFSHRARAEAARHAAAIWWERR